MKGQNLDELGKPFQALLKILGVDGNQDTSAAALMKELKCLALTGEINSFNLPHVITLVSQAKRTGLLIIERESAIKTLVFRNGRIVSAISNQKGDLLGQWLCDQGKLEPKQLDQALKEQKQSPQEKLGAILVRLGFISARELFDESISRVRNIIHHLFHNQIGRFFFLEGVIDWGKVVEIRGLEINELIFEGTRQLDEWVRWTKRALPPETILGLKKDWDRIELKDSRCREIIDLLRAGNIRVVDLCRGQDEVEILGLLRELIEMQVLEIKPESEEVIIPK